MKPGTYAFGPDNAELLVHTRRTGAAAKAGHDLVIEVGSWSGTLEIGEDPGQAEIALTADGGSLRVREGRGGMQALGDDDKANIERSIDDDVLKGTAITFRSTGCARDTDHVRVRGELELMGNTRPIDFALTVADDGRLSGSATIKQSQWGMKPFSILFGTLKVVDEVEVTIDGKVADLQSR
jgi:polyisoprenoid-binding protein YceI